MRKVLKFFLFFILLIIAGYTGLWFYSSHKLKQVIAEYSSISNNFIQFSYQDLKISGFPFKIKARFNNVDLHFNTFQSHYNYEAVKAETNILFNSITINFLGKLTSNFTIGDDKISVTSIDQGKSYLKFTESHSVNTYRLIKALYKNKIPKDLRLKECEIVSTDCTSFNPATGNKISTSSGGVKIFLDKLSEFETNISIKTDMDATIINLKELFNSKAIYFPFTKISLNNEIYATSKKQDDQSLLPFIDFKSVKIGFDDIQFIVSGTIQDDKNGKTIFDINLTANGWNNLLEILRKDGILSNERSEIITSAIKDITGEEPLQSTINFKIHNHGREIMLGKKSIFTLVKYSKEFITSK